MGIHIKDPTVGRKKTTLPNLVDQDELRKTQTKLKATTKELDRLKQKQFDTDQLMDTLRKELQALPAVKVTPHRKIKTRSGHSEDQILLFSDLHAGERIELRETDGFNEYNFEIMCRRLWKLQEKLLQLKDLQEHGIKIDRLYIFSLGDLVTGDIHNQDVTNELPILSTIQQTSLVISQMLLKFASAYREVVYTGIAGNHDRRHEKPRTKQAYDNWGTILNWCVSLLCRNQRNIVFQVPKSPFCVQEIRGWKWLLRHGHGKTASFAGIPFYGINKKHSALQELYRKRGGFEYEALGHYHQQTTLKDDRVFINGSIIGANEFAINELAAFSPPSQKLIGIDNKHGITYTYRLILDDAPEHHFIYDPERAFDHKCMIQDFISTQFDGKRR